MLVSCSNRSPTAAHAPPMAMRAPHDWGTMPGPMSAVPISAAPTQGCCPRPQSQVAIIVMRLPSCRHEISRNHVWIAATPTRDFSTTHGEERSRQLAVAAKNEGVRNDREPVVVGIKGPPIFRRIS